MTKKRLKTPYLLLFLAAVWLLPLIFLETITKTNVNDYMIDETEEVSEEPVDYSLPVLNETIRIIQPFTDPTVSVVKTFYNYEDPEEEQLKSILYYENTYMQNTGIDYQGENVFEVIAILDGEVTNVKQEGSSGKTVEITHRNGITSSYQSLQEIKVNKGEMVSQGQVIGTSGENELEKDLGNHLHLEIYENGQSKDPNLYLNQEIPYEKEEK